MKRSTRVLLSVAGVLALVYAAEEADSSSVRSSLAVDHTRSPERRVLATRTHIDQKQSRQPIEAGLVYMPRQQMISVVPGTDVAALAARTGVTVVADHGRDLVLVSGEADALDALAHHPAVLAAARNGVMSAAKKKDTPKKARSHPSESDDTPDTPDSYDALDSDDTSDSDDAPESDDTPDPDDAPDLDAEEPESPFHPLQWHHQAMKTPVPSRPLDGVVVAVIDSGVAYANYCGPMPCPDGWTPTDKQAPTLADTPIVAPIDYVAGDYVALDQNQHGTHIATSILGQGGLPGVAPGATLMPVRVLDMHNRGYEFDLIHAIYWSVDRGADILNMSLSFAPGYTASPHLLEALAYAHEHGVLMIGATGNAGLDSIGWPARSPYVVAVGASAPTNDLSMLSKYGKEAVRAPYSNGSPSVDVLAPGGNLLVDFDQNGFSDGILAETIGPQDPSTTGWWLFEGTSQAAALVSGAAVHLLAQGATADQATWALQLGSKPSTIETGKTVADHLTAGVGVGHIKLDAALASYALSPPELHTSRAVEVGFAPYLERLDDGQVRPAVRFALEGLPEGITEVSVYATLSDGHSAVPVTCSSTATVPACTAHGDPVTLGRPGGHAWAVQVDAVMYDTGMVARPTGLLFATDALEAIFQAAAGANFLPSSFGLAVYWAEGADAELGEVAASFTFMAGGTGMATSPLGLIATPAAVFPGLVADDPTGTSGTALATSPLGFATSDLDSTLTALGTDTTSPLGDLMVTNGTGLATSPLGFSSLAFFTNDLDIDGTALATSPLGFVPMGELSFSADFSGAYTTDFVVVDGTALATSPLGFHGLDLLQPGGGGVDLAGVSLDGGVPIADGETGSTGDLSGTSIGTLVDAGGFTDAYSRDAASVLATDLLDDTHGQSTLAAPVWVQTSP